VSAWRSAALLRRHVRRSAIITGECLLVQHLMSFSIFEQIGAMPDLAKIIANEFI
jgi:hypothetical protein